MVVISSLPPPSEGVDHVQASTMAFVDENCLGSGTLYIAKERVSWCGMSGQGFSLEYTGIAVHAICKDTSKFPHECIYCMLDSPIRGIVSIPCWSWWGKWEGGPMRKACDAGREVLKDKMEANEDDEDSKISEVRFVPEDKTSLERIFNVLSDCQMLHPDPQEEAEEEMAGFGGEYFTSEGDVNLTDEGQAILQRLENSFQQSAGEETVVTPAANGKETNGHADQDVDMEEEAGQFEDAQM